MEESLTKLFKLNETLISKKDEIRKKLFEKCINLSGNSYIEDSSFFCDISRRIKDKEFNNLRIKYEKLRHLIYDIKQLEKEEEEEV